MTVIPERLALCDQFLAVLRREASRRHLRTELVELMPGLHEPAWVRAERRAMWIVVDELRRARGLPSVSLDDVWRAETLACGHIDYLTKYAMHCADLVLDAGPGEVAAGPSP